MTSLAVPSNELAVPPRFATQRDPGRPTHGGNVARVAEMLGTPLMPWQRYVADVTGEIDPATGLFVHRFAVTTIQRQAGKTTLDLAISVQRCLMKDRQRVWHTAQTGQDARKKWGELVDTIMGSPLREVVDGKPKRSNGSEELRFVNGSILRPHPPTRDSLHGQQSDTNNIDEAWAFDEAQGDDLVQAILPTQLTRPGAQTFIWSTAGDRSSVWFRNLVNRGRSGDPGMAYFEWSIPDHVDPADLQAVAEHHPAVRQTVTIESLRAAQTAMRDKPGEFARAYGNRWTGAGERVIPLDAWNLAATTDDLPAGAPAFGVAVSADGAWGAVVTAVPDAQGRPWCEVLAHRPGRSWLIDYVRKLKTKAPVAVERRGPSAPVADALELSGIELVRDGRPDYPAACQDFFDRITDTGGPRILLRAHEALDLAADVAGRRPTYDGGWTWSRTRSTGDISALEAATLAAHAVARQPAPAPAPLIHFG
jgi:hypothetical protein